MEVKSNKQRNLLKLPDDLEGNLRALLHTPPPPYDIPGSRKAAPKPPAKRKKKRVSRKSPPLPNQAAINAQARHKVLGKRKAAKKR